MSRDERKKRIENLSGLVGFPIISYITCTRRGAEAQMNADAVRYIYDHAVDASKGKKLPKLGLLIHSYGGDPGTSWRIMSLLREYAEEVVVLVPYQAFSAATLVALGADTVLMHPMAALGPTDPSIINPLNPKDANGNLIPVSVEDVLSYIALVKEDVRINHEDELVQAFNKLVDQVHPLALGNVKRSHSQGKLIARKLLKLRNDKSDEHKINEIAENLTSKLFYHGHPINREEARTLDLHIENPDAEVEAAMWELYEAYERDLKLAMDFNPTMELSRVSPTPPAAGPPSIAAMPTGVPLPPGVIAPPPPPKHVVSAIAGPVATSICLELAMVESVARCDTLVNTVQLTGTRDPLAGIVNARVIPQGAEWLRG